MARYMEMVKCPPKVWTALTNAATAKATFQVQGGAVKIRVTTGAEPATADLPGWIYHARPAHQQYEQGERAINLVDLAASIASGYLYAMPIDGRQSEVLVDHI